MKQKWRALLTALSVISLIFTAPAPASQAAGGKTPGSYVLDSWSGGSNYTMDSTLLASGGHANIFWSHTFHVVPPTGTIIDGYIGMQTLVKDGSGLFLMSTWNTTDSQPGPDAFCIMHDEDGSGRSCRIAGLSPQIGHTYRTKLSIDADGWFTGSIDDLTANTPHLLGKIKAPAGSKIKWETQAWTEYFDWNTSTTTCFDSPYSNMIVSTISTVNDKGETVAFGHSGTRVSESCAAFTKITVLDEHHTAQQNGVGNSKAWWLKASDDTCLTATKNVASGSPLQATANCDYSSGQIWVHAVDNTFRNRYGNLCLNATGGSIGAEVNNKACDAGTSQQWIYLSDDRIKNIATDLCLSSSLTTGSPSSPTGISLQPCNISTVWQSIYPDVTMSITQIQDQSNVVGNSVSVPVVATSSDIDPVTYTAIGLPDGAAINPNTGVISGTTNTAGKYRVQVTALSNQVANTSNFSWVVHATPCVPSLPFKTSNESTDRLAGENRYETAVLASQKSYPGTACVVYLDTGKAFPDGLTTAPIAANRNGVMLLTPSSVLSDTVKDEIVRLQPREVVLVGGESAIPSSIQAEIKTALPETTVARIAGSDRYETNRALINRVFNAHVDDIWVATGKSYADALVTGGIAAKTGSPLILVSGTNSTLDENTIEFLQKLTPKKIHVVGGENAVSAGIYNALAEKASVSIERVYGVNRYDTAVNLNAIVFTENTDQAFLVSGEAFADALVSGVSGYRGAGPVMLVRKACIPQNTAYALKALNIRHTTIFGATSAISDSVKSGQSCP